MNHSILVVDDEYNSRMGVAFTLEQWGEDKVKVEMADNGKQAIRLLREKSYDLLITDIRMPLMSGIELLETLRGEQNDINTILLTGFAEFEYAQKGLKLGAVDYLLKPIRQEQLIQAVGKVFQSKSEEAANGLAYGVPSTNAYIISAVKYIHESMGMPLSIKEVAQHVHLNPSYFSVLFKEETGVSFSDYVIRLRMKRAKELLYHSPLSLDGISEQIGLQTASYFIRFFKKYEGITPKQYREQLKMMAAHGSQGSLS
ncbi:response regulator [Paenibacillus sp. KS-LC4]|uniref:response regulator transcription factor n=1 Tax=Paenibacillus sp. KS-LC4 TaxID=2979727 RepID=UPI0030CB278E